MSHINTVINEYVQNYKESERYLIADE